MMIKKVLGLGTVVLVCALVVGALALWVFPGEAEARYGEHRGSGQGPALSEPSSPVTIVDDGYVEDLSPSEVDALLMALEDEYKAWSVYDQVIDNLDAGRPFTNIQRAEEKHIAALVTLFDYYGLDIPPNEWPGNVPTFDTLADACEAGVQAEIDNAALYDELFNMVDNADILRVFQALQRASQTKHLPALEQCVTY
jgi:hypothetical protein